MEENIPENKQVIATQNSQKPIVGAIIIAGVLIAGAILLKDSGRPAQYGLPANEDVPATSLPPIKAEDRILGSADAKVTMVVYADFQCPFCGKLFKEVEEPIRDTYVKNGQVRMVYRDFAFLGPESERAAQAARCANDQGKFWEYHDYLYTHQSGENEGAFTDDKLKSYAGLLGLNTGTFNNCLDGGKYVQAVLDETTEGGAAGVSGTPKGYILRDGNVVATIDGAEPFAQVKQKIDATLK